MSTPSSPFVLPADLNIYEAATLKDALLDWLQHGEGHQVDGSAVERLDLAGLQVLLMLQAHGQRTGVPVQLLAASPVLSDTLHMLNVSFPSPAAP